MLKANHICSWSHFWHTGIKYQGGCFDTGCTSLPVLFDAFRQEPLRWYLLAYGNVYHGEHVIMNTNV